MAQQKRQDMNGFCSTKIKSTQLFLRSQSPVRRVKYRSHPNLNQTWVTKRHHLCQSPEVDATTNPRNVILWTRHPPTAHEQTFPVLSTRPLVSSHRGDKEDGTNTLKWLKLFKYTENMTQVRRSVSNLSDQLKYVNCRQLRLNAITRRLQQGANQLVALNDEKGRLHFTRKHLKDPAHAWRKSFWETKPRFTCTRKIDREKYREGEKLLVIQRQS